MAAPWSSRSSCVGPRERRSREQRRKEACFLQSAETGRRSDHGTANFAGMEMDGKITRQKLLERRYEVKLLAGTIPHLKT
jgi:hypothetical protein